MHRLLLLAVLALAVGCKPPGPVVVPAAGQLSKLGPGTHHAAADVPGLGNVKYTIDIPANYDGQTPVPLVLALHYGYDGAQPEAYTGEGMIDAFRGGLAELNAIVVAPDALGGDWTDAKNEQAAVWLVQSAIQTYAIDKQRVLITGFSLGGAGTWHIGSRHQNLFTAAIPVAAPVAGGKEWTIPVYAIHSEQDDIVSYSAAKKHAEAVQAKSKQAQFKTVSGLTHYDTGAYAPHVGDAVKWVRAEWK